MTSHLEAQQSNGNGIVNNGFNQSQFNQIQEQKEKDEKIAAAKLKLKRFKKETRTSQSSYNSGTQENVAVDSIYNRETGPLNVDTLITHESAYTSGRSTPASNFSSKQHGTGSQKSPFPYNSLTETSSFNNQSDYVKDQLQLHVQTIGILVAEKTELHSKLQQTIKKCDKTQDDNDELLGRLKASRHKITELEQLVQSQHEQIQNQQVSNSFSNSPTFENSSSDADKLTERMRSELNSMYSVNEELRMRLNEATENAAVKAQEAQFLQKSSAELKSQLELMNIKLTQFSMNDSADKKVENYLSEVDDRVLNDLKERNSYLEAKLAENEQTLTRQRDEIKTEYQNFVDQLQNQIESLVDQINRMTDERETAFAKLDSLETMLNKSNNQNDTLITDFNELKQKYDEAIRPGPSASSGSSNNNKEIDNGNESPSKEQLLENEIKYFKQQIEILVQDHNGLIQLVDEKEQAVNNLNKLVENYDKERGQHGALLDQAHNDKQALSRAVQQNKDLKKQLEELQDAFVNVTQQNLDLTTKLQAEEFKVKQTIIESSVVDEKSTDEVSMVQTKDNLGEVVADGAEESSVQENENKESDEWGEDEVEKTEMVNDLSSEPSLMDGIKKRIHDLEKENKDLNDYIVLVNKNLQKQSEAAAKKSDDDSTNNKDSQHSREQEEIIDRQLKKIEDLNNVIQGLETDLKTIEISKTEAVVEENIVVKSGNEIVPEANNNPIISDTHTANFKLLEDKFTKVMKDNADLKDKNQELEHMIMQLQCETDTIVDYITMYQMERKKLNQKYKEKDETIRSLSTQLQLNKLALQEINNYLSTYMKYSDTSSQKKAEEPLEEDATEATKDLIDAELEEIEVVQDDQLQKKQHLLAQMEKLLATVTQNSSSTLNTVNAAIIAQKTNSTVDHGHSHGHGHSHDHSHNNEVKNNNKHIDGSSVKKFRSEIILCSSCDGELFIV